jgi:hypothetical protein
MQFATILMFVAYATEQEHLLDAPILSLVIIIHRQIVMTFHATILMVAMIRKRAIMIRLRCVTTVHVFIQTAVLIQ